MARTARRGQRRHERTRWATGGRGRRRGAGGAQRPAGAGHPVAADRGAAVGLGPRHRRGHRPGQDHGASAWSRRSSRAACCGPPERLHGRARACGAGPTWPGSSWELPPETQRMMRDLAARSGRRSTSTCSATSTGSASPSRRARSRCATSCTSATSCRCGPARRPRCCCATPGGLLTGSPAARRTATGTSAAAGVDRPRPRHQGFAVSHGEREDGLSAVAVPVLGRSGTVVAALSLSGPTVRFTDERVDAVRRGTCRLAAAA